VVNNIERDEEQLNALMIIHPVEAEPINQDLPEIVDWMVVKLLIPKKEEKIRIVRADGSESFWKSFKDILRKMSRADLNKMYEIGKMKLDGQRIDNIIEKVTWDWIQMMYEPEKFPFRFGTFKVVKMWIYFEVPGVHQVILEDGEILYMLTDREYDMNLSLLRSLKLAKLHSSVCNEVAQRLVYMILNQIHRKEQLGKKSKNWF
jgi:hypothetical protein